MGCTEPRVVCWSKVFVELELGQELNMLTLSVMEGWSEVLEKGAGVGAIVELRRLE